MSLTELARTSDPPSAVKGGKGFYKPKGWGFFGLGPVGSVIATVAAFLVIVSLLTPVGIVAPAVIVLVTAVFLALATFPDRHGKTALQRWTTRWAWNRSRRGGSTTYTPSTLTHMGSHKLPGVLASSTLAEYVTDGGDAFAVLSYPSHHYYAVSVEARPDGASLLDDADIERQVTNYGHWLASLAQEPDFIQGIVTIETAPNSGPLMQQSVRAKESGRAHSLSKTIMQQVVDQYPQGSQGVRVTVTATFRAPRPELGLDGKKVKRRERLDEAEQIGQLLAIRLPHLMADLPDCGAGSIVPLSCDDLIERVRVAYNPQDRRAYDDARAQGKPRPVTLWNAVGPAGAEDAWNWYRHSGGSSVTWEFTGFTSPVIRANGLLPLLETGGNDSVTRLSIIYQPMDPARAARVVESNYNAAQGRVRDTSKPAARQIKTATDADRARASEADGHALVDFAVLVTTTAEGVDALARAKAAVQRIGPNARLNLRPMNGLQAAGFAQNVGVLGLVPDRHLRLPRALMNGM